MTKIFISYRRDDSIGHTGRLYDQLSTHFGEDQIFMDISNILPGKNFIDAIDTAVSSCDILLVCIGKQWLTITDVHGQPRLNNPTDFVRLEITTALNRDIYVIPVLLQGALMPRAQDLPDAIAKLTQHQAIELSDHRWRYDVEQLIAVMKQVLTNGAS